MSKIEKHTNIIFSEAGMEYMWGIVKELSDYCNTLKEREERQTMPEAHNAREEGACRQEIDKKDHILPTEGETAQETQDWINRAWSEYLYDEDAQESGEDNPLTQEGKQAFRESIERFMQVQPSKVEQEPVLCVKCKMHSRMTLDNLCLECSSIPLAKVEQEPVQETQDWITEAYYKFCTLFRDSNAGKTKEFNEEQVFRDVIKEYMPAQPSKGELIPFDVDAIIDELDIAYTGKARKVLEKYGQTPLPKEEVGLDELVLKIRGCFRGLNQGGAWSVDHAECNVSNLKELLSKHYIKEEQKKFTKQDIEEYADSIKIFAISGTGHKSLIQEVIVPFLKDKGLLQE